MHIDQQFVIQNSQARVRVRVVRTKPAAAEVNPQPIGILGRYIYFLNILQLTAKHIHIINIYIEHYIELYFFFKFVENLRHFLR